MRILVVEDERKLNELTTARLVKENYSVDSCYDGEAVFDYISCATYDLILLDIMLPKMDGLQVLRKLRGMGIDTPVLLLTARDEIEDRVNGLDAGADDYLVKPFAYEELLARMRVLLRRQHGQKSNEYTAGDLKLCCNTKRVYYKEEEVKLSAREYAILECLLRNKGAVMSREQIGNHVWNYDYVGSSNIVDVYIRSIRNKLGKEEGQQILQTVRGMGYVIKEEKE